MLDFALDFGADPIAVGGKETEPIVPFTAQALAALKRLIIVGVIALAFVVGLFGAIYLSLRSSETKVPDIVGKDRAAAENTISSAGLNFRVRATRPTSEAQPDTVIFQLPHAGEVVKVGQTVAVDISRSAKEGESSSSTTSNTNANTNTEADKKPENKNTANSQANSNDNKPKRKPANANGNENSNKNTNRPANQNRNTNANRATPANANANANRTATPAHNNLNSNSPKGNANTNRRAPVPAPTP